jgi:hypothetical protein
MAARMRRVWFSGLDPVPIRVMIAEDAAETAVFSAACLPACLFIRTVRPYRLRQPTAESYELVIGPEGFGAVLLEALQWLARVTAAGVMGTVPQTDVQAYVQHYLDSERPDWRFEEISEHAATFIRHRYEHAAADAEYRRALVHKHDDFALTALMEELRRWVAREP